jgi:hypothetical protein
MLQLLTAILALVAPADSQPSEPPDRFVTVDLVELPAMGFTPSAGELVVHMRVRGCRSLVAPDVEKRGTMIYILPRSQPGEGRCPSANASKKESQTVRLGALVEATYRIKIVTEDSTVTKVLNIY